MWPKMSKQWSKVLIFSKRYAHDEQGGNRRDMAGTESVIAMLKYSNCSRSPPSICIYARVNVCTSIL